MKTAEHKGRLPLCPAVFSVLVRRLLCSGKRPKAKQKAIYLSLTVHDHLPELGTIICFGRNGIFNGMLADLVFDGFLLLVVGGIMAVSFQTIIPIQRNFYSKLLF